MSRRKAAGQRRVSKTERWLNLLAFLIDRRYPVSREQILSEVEDYCGDWLSGDEKIRESVRRKFERDKHDLRALGVTIEPQQQKVVAGHTRGEVDAYLLRPRDLYLPYLELASVKTPVTRPYHLPSVSIKPEEVAILRRAAEQVLVLGATPLGASATSALRKLSFDLPGVAPSSDEVALTLGGEGAVEPTFALLRQAVEQRVAVRCRYYSIGRDREEERVIEPYGLMLTWGHWYCIARARERNAIRVFRLERMRSAALLEDADATFVVPADFTVRSYLDRAPWELSESEVVTVRVRIGFPHSRWVITEGLGRVVEAVDDAGGALLEFDVRAADAFIRWLLPFGAQVEILEPADLALRLRTERERVRALYS